MTMTPRRPPFKYASPSKLGFMLINEESRPYIRSETLTDMLGGFASHISRGMNMYINFKYDSIPRKSTSFPAFITTPTNASKTIKVSAFININAKISELSNMFLTTSINSSVEISIFLKIPNKAGYICI